MTLESACWMPVLRTDACREQAFLMIKLGKGRPRIFPTLISLFRIWVLPSQCVSASPVLRAWVLFPEMLAWLTFISFKPLLNCNLLKDGFYWHYITQYYLLCDFLDPPPECKSMKAGTFSALNIHAYERRPKKPRINFCWATVVQASHARWVF